MEPLVFFGIVLILAIVIGVFFENFALDVKSGQRRPLAPPPRRRPPSSGPGQTKIWRSQLMHTDDKRPKPKPSKGLSISETPSPQTLGGGQTKIWRSQKEYRSDGLPKPKPTQEMSPLKPGSSQGAGPGQTKIWRSQQDPRLEGLPNNPRSTQGMSSPESTTKQNPLSGESSSGRIPSNRNRKVGSDESVQTGRLPQGKFDATGTPKSSDRQTPPRVSRGAHDRPIARPGQSRYSAYRRMQADQTNQPTDPSFDTHLGGSNLGKFAGDRSSKKRSSQKPYSADEPTRIQYTDRLRPINQPRKPTGSSRSLNSANDRTSRNSSQSRQQPSNRAKNQSNSSEPFNPADYEQTYIGPFLDEDAIEALNLEVDSPPPDVVYQETHLGPYLDDDVIEEIQEDEIEELKLEGDVHPFDSAYYDQTFIGSGVNSADDRTHIGFRGDPGDAAKHSKDGQPLNVEEDSTLLWRRPEEKSKNPRKSKDDRFKR